MNLSELKSICQHLEIAPSKNRGQNFLIDKNVAVRLIKASGLTGREAVLEVGPGFGILTAELLGRAGKVVAIELDRKIFYWLKKNFQNQPNFILKSGDVLKVDLAELGLSDRGYQVVAALPYNITANFFRKVFSRPPRPVRLTVIVQKETAERILAKPGEMNLLALTVQLWAEPRILFSINRSCFWPRPRVASAALELAVRKNPLADPVDKIVRLAKIGFSSRRKQLQKNLTAGLGRPADFIKKALNQSGLDEKIRAEELSPSDWSRLRKNIEF